MSRIFRIVSIAIAVSLAPACLQADRSRAAGADQAHGDHAHHIGHEGVDKDPASVDPDLAIYTFVVFLLLLAILWKFAWGPIAQALDKREADIRKDIDDAEQARLRAEQMLREHQAKLDSVQDDVKAILDEARRDAEQAKQNIIAEAQSEAALAQQRAITEIHRARDQSLKEIFDVLADEVVTATEHVLGRSFSDEDQQRFVEEALAQFARPSGDGQNN